MTKTLFAVNTLKHIDEKIKNAVCRSDKYLVQRKTNTAKIQ